MSTEIEQDLWLAKKCGYEDAVVIDSAVYFNVHTFKRHVVGVAREGTIFNRHAPETTLALMEWLRDRDDHQPYFNLLEDLAVMGSGASIHSVVDTCALAIMEQENNDE